MLRVFFSTRDSEQRNRIGFVDLDLEARTVVDIAQEPALDLGALGHFDADGVYGGNIIDVDRELWLYYAGWNAGARGVFYSSIGLARSKDGGVTFQRESPSPVLGRDEIDPWACMAPFVLREPDSWRMYYASGIRLWRDEAGTLRSEYATRSARSTDGLYWQKQEGFALPLSGDITNVARVCVLRDDASYLAWYPYASATHGFQYRIGHARSEDGRQFRPVDGAPTVDVSRDGWDALAVTYPYVFDHGPDRWMLYNGNEYGRTGFGLARLEG